MLLVIGLATRFSALGLLIMTGVIQLVVPEAWANFHLPWAASIFMARAQDGDGAADHRLLQDIVPYLRSLAARRHRDPNDGEDAVQDILLTIHSIRQTYDPARPFGPWLVTIANWRFIDRLRRQGRVRAQETPLTAEHETFCEARANLEESTGRHELEGAVDNLPPGNGRPSGCSNSRRCH